MKRMTSLLTLALGTAILITFSGCLKDKCESTLTYQAYQPVYVKMDEVRNELRTEAPRTLKTPGNIYVYQNYLFIAEHREGIHVIDNSDPSNPTSVSFIKIPGCENMAVRGNILYANSYVDLVSLDISNPLSVQLVCRTNDMFEPLALFEDLGYLVYYEPTTETVERPCDTPIYYYDFGGWGRKDVLFVSESAMQDNASGNANAPVGIGGSMARFTMAANRLYAVGNYDMKVFGLNNEGCATLNNTINLGWGIETIFPYQDKLFIGSSSGMFIYDNSNPDQPTQLAAFAHARACDPVYVSGNTAYVTLRDGTECTGFVNQLDVVNITNITNPVLLKSYPMHHPHGLSINAEEKLFLCEGDQGLKIFDATEWAKIDQRLLSHQNGFFAFDVITLDDKKVAIVVGKDGLRQFDYSNPAQPRELSLIPVQQ
ncbi:MAG: hypothetical protein HUU01_17515 [Saprospiraceae bacterium]|nr:hypothetical protein [Saprospiraceae bacterium]